MVFVKGMILLMVQQSIIETIFRLFLILYELFSPTKCQNVTKKAHHKVPRAKANMFILLDLFYQLSKFKKI